LPDIVGAAGGAGLNTLLAAVEAAGLVDTLQSTGPFTLFAPTDAAFDALPAGTLDALLNDTVALSNILLYHVVSGEVDAESAVAIAQSDVPSALTVQGGEISLTLNSGNLLVNGAVVTTADIQSSNGIIHVIDAVLIPPERISVGNNVANLLPPTTMLMPTNSSLAEAAGWQTSGVCDKFTGIAYHYNASDASIRNPMSLYFSATGEFAGIGMRYYRATDSYVSQPLIDAKWFKPVSENVWELVVTTRSPHVICDANAATSGDMGDRLVANAGYLNYSVPRTATDAQADGWVIGRCFSQMGEHWFRDLNVPGQAGIDQWDADTLLPIVPMYDQAGAVVRQGDFLAFFFAAPYGQLTYESTYYLDFSLTPLPVGFPNMPFWWNVPLPTHSWFQPVQLGGPDFIPQPNLCGNMCTECKYEQRGVELWTIAHVLFQAGFTSVTCLPVEQNCGNTYEQIRPPLDSCCNCSEIKCTQFK